MSKKISGCKLLLVMVLLIACSYCFAGKKVYTPTKDTFIDENSPGDVYGPQPHLVLRGYGGWNLESLLKFDISDIDVGTTVESATLNLYYWHYLNGSPGGNPFDVYRITSDWDESTTTWNSRPSVDSTIIDTATAPGSFGWIQWDVTGSVRELVEESYTNYGWQIRDGSLGNNQMTYFRSKDYASDPNYIPYLEVTTGCSGEWGYHRGDINKDCRVDLGDVAIVALNWLLSSDPDDPGATWGEESIIGAGILFDGDNTTEPATILGLYSDVNEGNLEPEDIITEYAGQTVGTGADLLSIIENTPDVVPGQTISMVVLRGIDFLGVLAQQQVHYSGEFTGWARSPNKECAKIYTVGGQSNCICQGYSDDDCWRRLASYTVHASLYANSSWASVSSECYNDDGANNISNECVAAVSSQTGRLIAK